MWFNLSLTYCNFHRASNLFPPPYADAKTYKLGQWVTQHILRRRFALSSIAYCFIFTFPCWVRRSLCFAWYSNLHLNIPASTQRLTGLLPGQFTLRQTNTTIVTNETTQRGYEIIWIFHSFHFLICLHQLLSFSKGFIIKAPHFESVRPLVGSRREKCVSAPERAHLSLPSRLWGLLSWSWSNKVLTVEIFWWESASSLLPNSFVWFI